MSLPEETAVVACMRNEGVLILEWVAYHRVIGFDRIVICSNDCTDGSDRLLDALAKAGEIIHLPHEVPQGGAPQDSGLRAAFEALEHTDTEWLAHIDADEFINIGHGNGTVPDLLDKAGMGDVIALPWWAFGDSGHVMWPGSVLEHFTQAESFPVAERCKFKSMFRFRKFTHANDHMPVGPKSKTELPDVRSADGAQLEPEGFGDAKRAKYRPFDLSIVPDAACINHYAVPSRDLFLMKNDRGDGQGKRTDKYHLGSRWHSIANQNDAENRSILRHLEATAQEIARLRGNASIKNAEDHCIDWFGYLCARVLTPAQVASWTKPTIRRNPL